MLQAMLDAAINWVRAGLPMKCLKIVLYNRNPSHLSSEEKKLVDLFTKNKAQVEKQQEAAQVSTIKNYLFIYFLDTSYTFILRRRQNAP